MATDISDILTKFSAEDKQPTDISGILSANAAPAVAEPAPSTDISDILASAQAAPTPEPIDRSNEPILATVPRISKPKKEGGFLDSARQFLGGDKVSDQTFDDMIRGSASTEPDAAPPPPTLAEHVAGGESQAEDARQLAKSRAEGVREKVRAGTATPEEIAGADKGITNARDLGVLAGELGEDVAGAGGLRALAASTAGVASASSFGLTDLMIKRIADASGAPRAQAEGRREQILGGITALAAGILTGKTAAAGVGGTTGRIGKNIAFRGGVQGLVRALGGKGGLGTVLATRAGVGGGMSASRNMTMVKTGDQDFETGARQVAIDTTLSLLGIVPEQSIKPGVKNFVGQVATQLVGDLLADTTITKRFQEQGAKEWFINEIPNLVAAVVFAGVYLGDKGFPTRQAAINASVKRTVRDLKNGAKSRFTRAGRSGYVDPRQAGFMDEAGNRVDVTLTDDAGNKTSVVSDPVEAQAQRDAQEAGRVPDGELSPLERPDDIPLGVNREPVVDTSLKDLSDDEFDAHRKKVNETIDEVEKRFDDEPGVENDIAFRKKMAAAQDEFESAEIEKYRRDMKGRDEVTLAFELLELRPDISDLHKIKAAIIVEEVKSQGIGGAMETELRRFADRSPDHKEILQGRMESVDKALNPRTSEPQDPTQRTLTATDEGAGIPRQDGLDPARIGAPAEGVPTQGLPPKAVTAEGPLLPPTGKATVDAEGNKRNPEGGVELPIENIIQTRPNKYKTWLRENFLPSRGAPRELYDKYVTMNAKVAMGKLESKQNVRRVNNLVEDSAKNSGRDKEVIRGEMVEVVNGKMTIEEFSTRNGLAADNENVSLIKEMQADKVARQQLLSESVDGTPALKRRLSEFDYYQTRVYERFLLGDSYKADQEDYRASVGVIADEISGKLGQISRVGKAIESRGGVDVSKWLTTGDTSNIEGASKSNQSRLRTLRDSYLKYADVVDSVSRARDGGLVLEADAVKVSDAAKDTVDYYLSKSDTAIQSDNGIQNLRRRVLDDMWRNLYGEVTDAAYTSGRSTEVQTKLLAQQAFFRDVHGEGRDKYWWERSAPGRVQMGKGGSSIDRLRYGPLAGKFVTQETYDLLHPTPKSNSFSRQFANAAYYKPQATMRLLKLYGPKTIARNYVTAYTGFALGSGDAMLPGYNKHFKDAHSLIARAYRGEEGAVKEMMELAGNNVFRTSTSSIIQDIDAASSKGPKNLGQRQTLVPWTKQRQTNTSSSDRFLRAAGNAYAYVDFPSKYAAYKARIDSGMTPEQASQHVQDLYQNRDRVPNIVGQIGQGGLADYFGYTYDSVRIASNQIKFARAEAKKGNIAPAAGFLVGHGLQSMLVTAKATAAVGGVWSAIHRLIRNEKDVDETSQVKPERIAALRDFQPEYYENAAQVSWEETKNGERTLFYTIMSGHTAWPVEDLAVGIGQRTAQGGGGESVAKSIVKEVGKRLGPGMYLDTLAKAVMGEPFGSKYNTKGIWDSYQIPNDSARGRIVMEAAGKYLADVYGGQPGQWATQTYDYMKGEDYRNRAEESGTYVNSTTPSDMLAGKAALVRTYKITKGDMERLIKGRVTDWSLAVSSAKQGRDEPARIRLLEEITGVVKNAKVVSGDWFTDEEYSAILRDAGLNKDEAEAAVSGDVSGLIVYGPDRNKTNLERVRNPTTKKRRRPRYTPTPRR